MTSTNDTDIQGVLPGLKLAIEVISPAEEARLIALIESCNPRNYPGDEQGGLRAISFGWNYEMASGTFSPCDPIPEEFAEVRKIAARFAGVELDEIVQILLNRYAAGASIPWHRDKSVWQEIMGLSLGAEATMGFRKPVDEGFEHGEARLRPRSLYLMSGEARALFDHSIPPVKDLRWSVTFRTFSEEGRRLRDVVLGASPAP